MSELEEKIQVRKDNLVTPTTAPDATTTTTTAWKSRCRGTKTQLPHVRLDLPGQGGGSLRMGSQHHRQRLFFSEHIRAPDSDHPFRFQLLAFRFQLDTVL